MAVAEPEDTIDRILRSTRTIAVVGLSPNPVRPSHGVALYLQRAGYAIIPVNPTVAEVLGQRAYPTLRDVPLQIDLVDIFRRSEFVAAIADDAIAVGAKALWMQDGVIDQASAERARTAGLDVVMDDCIMRQHARRARGLRRE
jgi:predicted CoA-binding protein